MRLDREESLLEEEERALPLPFAIEDVQKPQLATVFVLVLVDVLPLDSPRDSATAARRERPVEDMARDAQ